MIVPVFVETFFDIGKVAFRVGVESFFGELFDDFSFNFETFLGDIHESIKSCEEVFFICCKIADTWKIDGNNADGSCEWVGAEESSTTMTELAVVEAQSTAHTSGVIGTHVGIDEIGKIGNSVLGSHLPNGFKAGIFPIEIFRDVVGGNRKCEDAPRGVAFTHDLSKCAIDHGHFLWEIPVRFFLWFATDDDVFTCECFWWDDVESDI